MSKEYMCEEITNSPVLFLLASQIAASATSNNKDLSNILGFISAQKMTWFRPRIQGTVLSTVYTVLPILSQLKTKVFAKRTLITRD